MYKLDIQTIDFPDCYFARKFRTANFAKTILIEFIGNIRYTAMGMYVVNSASALYQTETLFLYTFTEREREKKEKKREGGRKKEHISHRMYVFLEKISDAVKFWIDCPAYVGPTVHDCEDTAAKSRLSQTSTMQFMAALTSSTGNP